MISNHPNDMNIPEKRLSRLRHNVVAVLLAMVLLPLSACWENEEEESQPKRVDITTVQPTDTVWICTGSNSKRYHASDSCAGVSSCTKEVRPVTRADAEKRKRTFCHICFRDSLDTNE